MEDKLFIDVERKIIGGVTTVGKFKEQIERLKQEIQNELV